MSAKFLSIRFPTNVVVRVRLSYLTAGPFAWESCGPNAVNWGNSFHGLRSNPGFDATYVLAPYCAWDSSVP